MLRDSADRGDRMRGDGAVNQHNRASHADTPTLAELGVSPMQSSRWQALAAMPTEHRRTAVANAGKHCLQLDGLVLPRFRSRQLSEAVSTYEQINEVHAINYLGAAASLSHVLAALGDSYEILRPCGFCSDVCSIWSRFCSQPGS
jgi:hypothetical protein